MFRNTHQTQSNESKPLLTWRLINSLPLVPSIKSLYPSAKELYLNTKISNPLLNAGLDYAEGSIAAASAPFISRYEKMDSFASSKLEELEEAYDEGLPTLAKKGALQGVRAVAYPVGFTLEMAHQARGKAIELATPAIARAYSVANGMVDVLIPGEPNEDVYDRISGQTRSPIRRLRRRMNARALAQLPINAFYFSLGASSVFTYEALLIGRTMQDYLWSQLDRSLYVLAGLEAFLVAQPLSVLGHNLRHATRIAAENTEFVVQALLTNALARSEVLQSKLEDSKLPKTAHLVHRLSDDLQNLSAFFGIHVGDMEHPLMIEASSSTSTPIDTPPRSRRVIPAKRTRVQELSRRHVNPYITQRMPTFFSGNDALARTEQIDNERTSGIMTGEGVAIEPTIIEAMDSDAYNSSLPSSGNVSEIDESEDFRPTPRYLTVKHAGALTSAFLRGLRGGYKTTPPTPANSPVPHHVATPKMPMVVITQQAPSSAVDITEDEHTVTALLEEKLDGKHDTLHMPSVTMTKPKAKPIADSNPFDALTNAPDMTEDAEDDRQPVPRTHNHNHTHTHNHGHHGYTSKHAARVAHRAQVHAHHAVASVPVMPESVEELVVVEAEVVVEEPKMTEEEVHVAEPVAIDQHTEKKKHTTTVNHAAKPVDVNPFDALADAADPMGSPLNERITLDANNGRHHNHKNHHHSGNFTSKHQARVHARQVQHEAAVHDDTPVATEEEVVLSVPENLEVESPVDEITTESHEGEEEHKKRHHHHRAAHHHEKPSSENPFDALADAPDPMGSPMMTQKVHVHHHAHHQAGQASI